MSDGLLTVGTSLLDLLPFLITSVIVVRAGLVTGKLSQTTQSFHIVRASARAFEREQWETLEKRLSAWKIGLAGVLEFVTSAKKRNTPDAPTPTVANGVETTSQQPQTAAA